MLLVGDELSKAGSYLKAACLMGVLKPQTSNGLNLVSAPAYAKELGMQASVQIWTYEKNNLAKTSFVI